MTKYQNICVDEQVQKNNDIFIQKMNSKIVPDFKITGDAMSFEWLDEIEFACPYIDNIVRNPRPTLVSDNYVEKIEKAKKIGAESVKDLTRHTNYIEKVDEQTNEIQPSKILVLFREETFNTYENRFIYTLIIDLSRFIMKKEDLFKNLEIKSDKTLEFHAATNNGIEKINVDLKISAKELNNGKQDTDSEIEKIKQRLKKVHDYISSWKRGAMVTQLDKLHVPLVLPPIKKTNMILKNPNFQIAMKLWNYLRNLDENEDNSSKSNAKLINEKLYKNILNNNFLNDYLVLDAISSNKIKQKEKLPKYAVSMLINQIKTTMTILEKSGIKISNEELFEMLKIEIQKDKNQILIGSNDVKKKFMKEMDEYLARTKEYL